MSEKQMSDNKSNAPSDEKKEKMKYVKEYIKRINKTHIDSKINMLKNMYIDKYVIKYEDIPESYYKLQEQIALERGYGHVRITENQKGQWLIRKKSF